MFKVRRIGDKLKEVYTTGGFVVSPGSDILRVIDRNGECLSFELSKLELKLKSGKYKKLEDCLRDRDVIFDYIRYGFDYPHGEVEKEQGFNW